ncbi:PRL-1 phosphatase-like isoform X2 [Cylas formicarius]|uniref:PRL-1 phosphatase-like isoform X2 n=1 Tax=Cylas formicarius TaxID=197179 RepID=UPI00295871CC|nr:PRL-1 phosphatase-like isoform X2 [Cylas formicarius]
MLMREIEHFVFNRFWNSKMSTMTSYAPAEISYKGFRFLITMKPTNAGMLEYIQELKKHRVTAVVKLCEEGYDTKMLNDNGIVVLDLSFPDGKAPPDFIMDEWFKVLKNQFEGNADACIAVHCVSGLGRAPVLVALALIELGLKYEEAVELIREKRRGAINTKQLEFLEKYKRRHRLDDHHKKSCILQ